MIKIVPEEINRENFNTFGSVVTTPQKEPTAAASTFTFWSDIAHYTIDTETEIGLCAVFRQSETVINEMERHLHTPEILIPIDAPFVLPLLHEGEKDGQIQAFQVNIGQAVIIDAAVWHGACIPVGKKQSSYFVIFRRGTPHNDIEKKAVTSSEIEL